MFPTLLALLLEVVPSPAPTPGAAAGQSNTVTLALISSFTAIVVAGVTAYFTSRKATDNGRKLDEVQQQITTNHGKNIGQHVEANSVNLEDVKFLVTALSRMVADFTVVEAVNNEAIVRQVIAHFDKRPVARQESVCHIGNCRGGCGMVHNPPPSDENHPWIPGPLPR